MLTTAAIAGLAIGSIFTGGALGDVTKNSGRTYNDTHLFVLFYKNDYLFFFNFFIGVYVNKI